MEWAQKQNTRGGSASGTALTPLPSANGSMCPSMCPRKHRQYYLFCSLPLPRSPDTPDAAEPRERHLHVHRCIITIPFVSAGVTSPKVPHGSHGFTTREYFRPPPLWPFLPSNHNVLNSNTHWRECHLPPYINNNNVVQAAPQGRQGAPPAPLPDLARLRWCQVSPCDWASGRTQRKRGGKAYASWSAPPSCRACPCPTPLRPHPALWISYRSRNSS